MPTSLRFWRILRRSALIVPAVLVCSWILLYLDSVYQRRKAEHFVAELKAFPFATAGFVEVRDLVARHGGISIQQFPDWQFPQPGVPFVDSHDHVHMPVPHGGGPICTVRNCTFEIWIRPRLLALPLNYQAVWWLQSALAYVGIRPWGVYARFEIRNGRLAESHTSLGQLRNAKADGPYVGLVPLEYEVVCMTHFPYNEHRDYVVGASADNLSPLDFLSARLAQTPNAPTRRAFDVDLHCLTLVMRSCHGFSELAPSAWADYQAGMANPGQK